MMTGPRRLLTVGIATLAVPLSVPIVAHACSITTSISLSPTSGQARSVTTVYGAGFAAGPVQVRWGSPTGPLLATAQGPTIAVPITVPNVAPGPYYVDAMDGVGDVDFVSAVFSVTVSSTGAGATASGPVTSSGSAPAPAGSASGPGAVPGTSSGATRPPALTPARQTVSVGTTAVGTARASSSAAGLSPGAAAGMPAVAPGQPAAGGVDTQAAPGVVGAFRPPLSLFSDPADAFARPGPAAPRSAGATGAGSATFLEHTGAVLAAVLLPLLMLGVAATGVRRGRATTRR